MPDSAKTTPALQQSLCDWIPNNGSTHGLKAHVDTSQELGPKCVVLHGEAGCCLHTSPDIAAAAWALVHRPHKNCTSVCIVASMTQPTVLHRLVLARTHPARAPTQ